ncbi:NnrS family protein [Halomonas halocynthiae]|uniref:NnrS family protein n=1 Tax=Halomonas halocynthiae TaxID=176290 RepID=UPI0004889330|nr:NnrS family protein [Halomonas halocynthiae]
MPASSVTSSPLAQLAVMRLAFRPFFLLASLFGIVSLLVWLGFWHGTIVLRPQGGLVFWHQHEMLFGFAAAVASGFLLTAVQNWTGLPSLKGGPLLGLVALWLAGRVLMAFPSSAASWLVAGVDLLFLPVVALIMARLVITAKRWQNLIFLPVLGLLIAANVVMHAGLIDGDPLLVRRSAYLAVLLITLLMVVVGGRVIEMFTANRLGRLRAAPWPALARLTRGSTFAVVLAQALIVLGIPLPNSAQVILLIIAALANAVSLSRWGGLHSGSEPLLWGLHGSYAFIPLGLAMWALSLLGMFRTELAVHALTIGAMGTMMLAMMSRVSQGHTGRPVRTLPGIGVALSMMLLAALIRSPLLVFFPQITYWTYTLSILLWCLAYGVFLFHYTVPLMSPRIDGKGG